MIILVVMEAKRKNKVFAITPNATKGILSLVIVFDFMMLKNKRAGSVT